MGESKAPGELLDKVVYREAPPEVQSLTHLYTILDRKDTLIVYL